MIRGILALLFGLDVATLLKIFKGADFKAIYIYRNTLGKILPDSSPV